MRFRLENAGAIVHKFNIGTVEIWRDHMGEMKRMMEEGMMTASEVRHDRMQAAGMMHHDAKSALLEPGETAKIVWTLPADGEIGFACNVPGHREAGMQGDVVLR